MADFSTKKLNPTSDVKPAAEAGTTPSEDELLEFVHRTDVSKTLVQFRIISPILKLVGMEETVEVALDELVHTNRRKPAFTADWRANFLHGPVHEILTRLVDSHGLAESLPEQIESLLDRSPTSLNMTAKRYLDKRLLVSIPAGQRTNLKNTLLLQLKNSNFDAIISCDVMIVDTLGRLIAAAYNAVYPQMLSPTKRLDDGSVSTTGTRERLAQETLRVQSRLKTHQRSQSPHGSTIEKQTDKESITKPIPEFVTQRRQDPKEPSSGGGSSPAPFSSLQWNSNPMLAPLPSQDIRDLEQAERPIKAHHTASFRRSMGLMPPVSYAPPQYASGPIPMSYRPTVSRIMSFNTPAGTEPRETYVPHVGRSPNVTTPHASAQSAKSAGSQSSRKQSDPQSHQGDDPSVNPSTEPPNRNPSWDSGNREGWAYPQSTHGIHQHRRHPQPVHGSHWWKYTLDPYENIQCDVDTGSIAPWYAHRPGFGLVLNHAVCLNMQHFDKNQFLSHFRNRGEFDSRMLREFRAGFPACPDDAELGSLLKYHATVVKYATIYKVFVPPAHTLRSHNILGIWYKDLNDDYQSHVGHTFPQILAQCLQSKNANLTKQKQFGKLLAAETNGYHTLYQLALIGGHPLLASRPTELQFPMQKDDMSLQDYALEWIHHLNIRSLDGHHYSDRFFIQEFSLRMNPSLSSLQNHLRHSLNPFEVYPALHDPLPEFFYPEKIVTWFTEYALMRGNLSLVRESPRSYRAQRAAHPSLFGGTTTRSLRSAVKHTPPKTKSSVHALSHSSADTSVWDEAPLTEDEQEAWHVRAITARPRGCYWCQSDTHQLFDCPRAQAARDDPHKRRLIRKMLDGPSVHAPKGDTQTIHQVQAPPLEAGEGIEDHLCCQEALAHEAPILNEDVDF